MPLNESELTQWEKENVPLPRISLRNEPHREKTGLCLCENKGADQLRSNCEADQRLCFRYSDSTIPLLLIAKYLACSCDCTDRFVSDPFGNHIVGFPTRRPKWCLRIFIFVVSLIDFYDRCFSSHVVRHINHPKCHLVKKTHRLCLS